MPADPRLNRVLDVLMHGDQLTWTDQLEWVELTAHQELHAQGAAVQHIHFPTSALVVLMQTSAGGGEVPVAMVGNDGVLGVAALMGVGTETSRAVVVHPGFAWRLSTSAVPMGGPSSTQVVRATMDHLLSLTAQIAQTAFCQQHHDVEQRLSRWLLTALDRLPDTELAIELSELAPLLGVPGDVLAQVVARLVDRGTLVCESGRMTVLTLFSLQTDACGCHAPVKGRSPPTSSGQH